MRWVCFWRRTAAPTGNLSPPPPRPRTGVGAWAVGPVRTVVAPSLTLVCTLYSEPVRNTPPPSPKPVEAAIDPHVFLSPGAREAIQEAARLPRPRAPVPEPSTLIVFATGIGLLLVINRWK